MLFLIEFKEFIKDKQLIINIKEYIKIVINNVKSTDGIIQLVKTSLFLEFLSEKVAYIRRASTFVSLLQHTLTRSAGVQSHQTKH